VNVPDNGVDEFLSSLNRIGIIETQVALTPEIGREAEVNPDSPSVPDV